VRPLLDGVRVVDLSRVLAAPFTGRVLAEMGAEVVKVEYGRGDPAHAIGPHWGERSLYFSSLNSGKKGIRLDLTSRDGLRALDDLLASSDVVIENFRASTAKALGLEPRRLLQRHPRLVITSVTSYARDSDRSDEGAFDLTIQAEAGIMSVTGEPGRPPVRAGVPISDLAAGMWAVAATLGALFARERDGAGRHVEVPMLDAALPLLAYVGTTALAAEHDPEPVGSGHHDASPYGAYATRDGWVVIAALSDKFWLALCGALGLEELALREDLATNVGRAVARSEVDGAVAAKVAELTTAEALAKLRRADVPHAPVNGAIAALTAPYVAERGLLERIDAPEGTYYVATTPLKEEDVRLSPAPAVGEHTNEVLERVRGGEGTESAMRSDDGAESP
jgi:crotonobetainyl-CoA:carnitine CoA-transferase CaiB-like acyl-CoA transferase